MRTWLLMILCLTGCAAPQPHERWRPATLGNFTFSLPPTLQPRSSPQANPVMTQFTNQDMTVTFDAGASAGEPLDSLNHYGHYASHLEVIGGMPVQVVSFDLPPGGDHRFDYGMAASCRGVGLTIYTHCRTRDDYPTVLKLFQTVRLKSGHAPPHS